MDVHEYKFCVKYYVAAIVVMMFVFAKYLFPKYSASIIYIGLMPSVYIYYLSVCYIYKTLKRHLQGKRP